MNETLKQNENNSVSTWAPYYAMDTFELVITAFFLAGWLYSIILCLKRHQVLRDTYHREIPFKMYHLDVASRIRSQKPVQRV